MNVAVAVSVDIGSVHVMFDATDVNPDAVNDMTNRAIALVRALVTDADIPTSARETVTADPDDGE